MKKRPRIALWGTFDLLHDGHKTLLEKSAKYGEVYVIIIPDQIVLKNKGSLPTYNEEERRQRLLSLSYVKNCYIDSFANGMLSLTEKIKPDIFYFGYDQKTIWEENLRKLASLKLKGLKFDSLAQYANGIHSSDLKKKLDTFPGK